MVNCGIKLFADDAKVYKVVNTESDCRELQNDLAEMESWAKNGK